MDLSLFCDWSCASVEAPKKKKKAAAEAPFFRHVALQFKPQGRLHDGDDGDANICKIQMTSGTVFFFFRCDATAQLPAKTRVWGLSEGKSFRK